MKERIGFLRLLSSGRFRVPGTPGVIPLVVGAHETEGGTDDAKQQRDRDRRSRHERPDQE